LFADDQGILKGDLAQELGQEFDVETSIFERDYLLNAIVWAFKGDVASGYRHYIVDGRTNAEKIRDIIKSYCSESLPSPSRQNSNAPPFVILDFACGYGRVGRHFKNVMPEVKYVGMDIHDDAVRFNRDTLGLEMMKSTQKTEEFYVGQTFDFIFALSFFSHVRREHFLGWLSELHGILKPGGVLMISTHGQMSHQLLMPEVIVDYDGYGMIATSEQFDLSTDFYIHAITYPAYVEAMVSSLKGLKLLNFSEGFWFGHQDMYVLKNVAPAKRGSERILKKVKAVLKTVTNATAHRLRSKSSFA
jgi:SAM-dependent methyltransferase